jgi:hypothetical protein
MIKGSKAAAGASAAPALVLLSPTTASAANGPITALASGLDGPRQLSDYKGGKLVVAESDSGEVSSIDLGSGAVKTLLTGLGIAQGVDYQNGHIYVAVGAPPPEGPQPPADPNAPPTAVVLEASTDGKVLRTFDLLKYELDNNPDGQVQLFDGKPVDALSNPFSVLAEDDRLVVAHADANDVLSIDLKSGKISTFFVPPVVTDTPECANAENNPGTVGCDPVPTRRPSDS